MPAGERRDAFTEVFRLAQERPRQHELLLDLFDWLVINAPRPRGQESQFTVAQMNDFGAFMSKRLRDGLSTRRAIEEFAVDRDLDEQSLTRLWNSRPEYAAPRNVARLRERISKARLRHK
jgi:hypothetical protein